MRRYKKFEVTVGTEDDALDWNDIELWRLEEFFPNEGKVLSIDMQVIEEEKWMDDLMDLKKGKRASYRSVKDPVD
jgi:hypothetical protein